MGVAHRLLGPHDTLLYILICGVNMKDVACPKQFCTMVKFDIATRILLGLHVGITVKI